MSFEISGKQITLTRGDTFVARFPMQVDGEEYTLEDGDKCFFGVKADPDDENPIILKRLSDDYVLELQPNDTKGMDFGKYWYDTYITFADGRTLTYITEARLIIGKESHT